MKDFTILSLNARSIRNKGEVLLHDTRTDIETNLNNGVSMSEFLLTLLVTLSLKKDHSHGCGGGVAIAVKFF